MLSKIQDGPFNVNKSTSYVSQYPATVVDNPTDKRDWLWQIGQTGTGQPAIAMVRISSDKASHDYYYAEWNGSEWVKTFLANGGGHFHQTANLELCYSGGMAMNPYNPRELYVSIPVSGLNGKKYEIVKMTVGDDGTATQEAVTSNSGYNNVRPYFIPGSADSPLQLAWMHGNYYDWIVSSSRPDGYPTAIHCDYAWEDAPADLSDGLIAHETFDDIPDGDAYNGQSTATVASGILKTGKQAHAQTSLAAGTFTVSLSLQISSEQYYGDILSFGGLGYGLDSLTRKPYVRVGDERHPSTNLLGTSDIWREKGRDTNGLWYEPTKLQFFNLTLTYADGILTTYVNGLLDQQVEATGADLSGTMLIGGFKGWVEDYRTYSRVLNQGEIDRLAEESRRYTLPDEMEAEAAFETLQVPGDVYSDIVFTSKLPSGQTVRWTSSDEAVLSSAGIVTLPPAPVEITLTAVAGRQGSLRGRHLRRRHPDHMHLRERRTR